MGKMTLGIAFRAQWFIIEFKFQTHYFIPLTTSYTYTRNDDKHSKPAAIVNSPVLHTTIKFKLLPRD